MQKGANAFALEKKESTKEEKKAKWMKGGGTLGLASKGLGALTFKDNKKKTQNEAYNIMDKCKTTGLTFGVANDLVPLSQLKITMDTAKALNILGFPSHQTFESTSYESICTNFLTNLMMAMKNRKQAVMEAKGNKKGKKRTYQMKKDDEESWRREVVKINEAFQHLTRKKDRSDLAVKSWKVNQGKANLVTKTLECMAIDEGKKCVSNDERKKIQNAKKTESDRAQRLAEQIADHLHSMGIEEQKAKKG